jgi:hypothetical protein
VTMKRWSGLFAVAGLALAASVTSGLTCDDHKKAAATADAKAVKAVPAAETATAEKGCCAKKAAAAQATANGKTPKAAPAVAEAGCDKPCDGAAVADGAGCPKKKSATAAPAVAKAQPVQDAAPADPGKDN